MKLGWKNKQRIKKVKKFLLPVPKIIFLDIDGVLNSEVDYEKEPEDLKRYHDIALRPLKLLDGLIDETKAKIVVSSTWRSSTHTQILTEVLGKPIDNTTRLQMIFKTRGFKNWKSIIDVTPVLRGDGIVRGCEIRHWINNHEDILNCDYSDFSTYVILDDDSDMLLWQQNHYIKIDGYVGLTINNCYKAKYILNGFKYK